MKKFLFPLALLLMGGCAEKTPGYAEYWLYWGDTQLDKWVSNATRLETVSQAYCQGNLELVQLQNQIQDLALTWAEINGLPYHAIADHNLSFELYFWPDKRDMTRARLSRRLQNEEALTEKTLEEATASEKGLLALEWVGFSDDLNRDQRCALLPAISSHYLTNIRTISDYHAENPLVMSAWTRNAQNPEGRSIALNLLFQQLANLSNSLRHSVNTSSGELVPIIAQGWRMGISTEMFATSLNTVIRHLQVLAERVDLSASTRKQLQTHIAELDTISNELSDENFDWRALQQAVIATERLIEGPIAQEQNVLLGFSNYDGD
ncbi:MAG: imelysin family protein [Gammaproteobacteria bacterium]